MTGLFNQKPALPPYSDTWDPQIVLNHLKTFPAIDDDVTETAYPVTGHAYGAIVCTESSHFTVLVLGRNEYPTWKVCFSHLFCFKTNNCQRGPEQTFTTTALRVPLPQQLKH